MFESLASNYIVKIKPNETTFLGKKRKYYVSWNTLSSPAFTFQEPGSMNNPEGPQVSFIQVGIYFLLGVFIILALLGISSLVVPF